MSDTFHESRLKIERAEKHILDINLHLRGLVGSDSHTVSVEMDSQGLNWLSLDFHPRAFPTEELALVIGDALHNLRSSLDILWHQVIDACDGEPTDKTRFPIRDTEQKVKAALNGALKLKQISKTVHDFVLEQIQPYETGNYTLWALDDLNVRDKHKLIIPTIKIAWVSGASLKDDQGEVVPLGMLFGDESWRRKLGIEFYKRKLTVESQGTSSPNVFFQRGFPFESGSVLPALDGITKEVSRTIEAFALLFPD